MRKRKSPVLLVTVLIAAFGAVVFLSPRPKNMEAPPSDTPTVGEKVDTPDQKSIAAEVQKKAAEAKQAKLMKPTPKGPEAMGMPPRSGPVALKEKQAPYVPTPSDSMTSGQWWSDETLKDYNSLPDAKPKKMTPVPGNLSKHTP